MPEERALQISNDISEDMCSASKRELIEVVKYFRDKLDALWQKSQTYRTETALHFLKAGLSLMRGENLTEEPKLRNVGSTLKKLRTRLDRQAAKTP